MCFVFFYCCYFLQASLDWVSTYGLSKRLVPVTSCRRLTKLDMVLNNYLPRLTGLLLVCNVQTQFLHFNDISSVTALSYLFVKRDGLPTNLIKSQKFSSCGVTFSSTFCLGWDTFLGQYFVLLFLFSVHYLNFRVNNW